MNASFCGFTGDAAVSVAAACLSRVTGEPVAVEANTVLSGDEHRNHIMRAVARGAAGDRQGIVIVPAFVVSREG